MENLKASLQKICDLWKRYTENIACLPCGSQKYYPELYRELILYELFALDGAGIEDIKKATKISIPTIRKLISAVESTGLIKVDTMGRRYTYGISLDKLDELIP